MPRWDDEIVAVCPFQDSVYIFCRSGDIYRMDHDEPVGVRFLLVGRLFK